jgi:hypothetical protein
MDNLNILVEAKREYLDQLSILMCPVMIDVFDVMYQEAHKISKGRKVLIMFQKLLKDVPEWNETMAKEHTDNIADRCAWFKDLVAAVFVSSVKILSAVRLSKEVKKLSVKLPSNEVFIHSCYKNAAKDLYKNPYVFSENQSEYNRNDELFERFKICIEVTVKELIPVQQILQTYMTTTDDIIDPQDADLATDDVDEYDGEDPMAPPEESNGEYNPAGETEGMVDAPPEDLAPPLDQNPPMGEEAPPPPPPRHFENEFRTIPRVQPGQPQSQPPPPPPDDEDLFPDAPDSRIKNSRY